MDYIGTVFPHVLLAISTFRAWRAWLRDLGLSFRAWGSVEVGSIPHPAMSTIKQYFMYIKAFLTPRLGAMTVAGIDAQG